MTGTDDVNAGSSPAPDADPMVDTSVGPSGTGCQACLEAGGWWVHLRRCAACGLVSCCDSSPGQHASQHARDSGHAVIRSFEPGEVWFYDFRSDDVFEGPALAPPESRPVEQGSPAPRDRVPDDWRSRIH